MNEQKMKKKRTMADDAFIGGIVSFGLFFITFLFMVPTESAFGNKLLNYISTFTFFSSIAASIFSFFIGVLALIIYSKNRTKFEIYLKACVGIFPGILIFLIFLPNFLRFPAKSKQTEAKQNLGAIYAAYQAYHSDYNTYPSSPYIQIGNASFDCFEIAGCRPKGQIRYNYNCMGIEALSPSYSTACPPGIVTAATQVSFTVAACGNIDNDATPDVWTINDANHLRNVIDDVWNKKR